MGWSVRERVRPKESTYGYFFPSQTVRHWLVLEVIFLSSNRICMPNLSHYLFGTVKNFGPDIIRSYTVLGCDSPSWSSVQFSSVAQSCLILCDPMGCSMPGFPVHHQLLEPTGRNLHERWLGPKIFQQHQGACYYFSLLGDSVSIATELILKLYLHIKHNFITYALLRRFPCRVIALAQPTSL